MPQIGEIKRAKDTGRKGRGKLIWHACIDCGKERWVQVVGQKPRVNYCQSCARKGSRSYNWKHGRYVQNRGYVKIWLSNDDFFFPMVVEKKGRYEHGGYVLEHRLVMAKHLGRCLHRWEIVHHRNHVRDDNRIDNLQLVSDDRHTQITILENRINQLEQRILLLEAENIRLQEAVKV